MSSIILAGRVQRFILVLILLVILNYNELVSIYCIAAHDMHEILRLLELSAYSVHTSRVAN